MRYGVNGDPLREGKLDLPELLEEPTPEERAWARDFVAQRNWREAGHRPLQRRIAKALHGSQQALDELSTEDWESMAETVVAAALDGEPWAIQEIARVFDE